MTAAVRKPSTDTISEDVIKIGLQELAALYKHDYKELMPELLPCAGFRDEIEIARLGRLAGVVMKSTISKKKKISPDQSNTGSHYAYPFDLSKLRAPDFVASQAGKIYAALLDHQVHVGGGRAVGYLLRDDRRATS
jgi:hypothetical protein